MKKEIEFEKCCERIAANFNELASIITAIKNDYKNEHSKDPRLTMEIVNSSLKMVAFRAKEFLGYKERVRKDWDLEKYIEYTKGMLHSFFREFDNPFLGSIKWTPRIEQLMNILSDESRALGNILNNDAES